MKKKYMVLTVMVCAALMLTGCSGSASGGSGTLKVGVRDDIVNFGYLNPDTQQYYGFEIDLAKELATRLGYADVEYVTVTPDTRENMLESNEVDCLIAAYSITDGRKEKFDFSPAYYQDVSGVVVENTSLIQDYNGLIGTKIGGLEGANTEEALKEKLISDGLITDQDLKGTTFSFCATYEELVTQLEEGTLDAVCMDGCIANAYMDESNSFLEETIDSTEYGVATVKDSKLSQSVADGVQDMIDDGTVEKIKDKWD